MAVQTIRDLFDCKTLYMIGGSTEYFRLSLLNISGEPIDLSSVSDIEWFFGLYDITSNQAILYKSLKTGGVTILADSKGKLTNVIQVCIENIDTINLSGGFKHQIAIIDGDGKRFVPFQGLIVIDRAILIPN